MGGGGGERGRGGACVWCCDDPSPCSLEFCGPPHVYQSLDQSPAAFLSALCPLDCLFLQLNIVDITQHVRCQVCCPPHAKQWAACAGNSSVRSISVSSDQQELSPRWCWNGLLTRLHSCLTWGWLFFSLSSHPVADICMFYPWQMVYRARLILQLQKLDSAFILYVFAPSNPNPAGLLICWF